MDEMLTLQDDAFTALKRIAGNGYEVQPADLLEVWQAIYMLAQHIVMLHKVNHASI